MKKSTLLFLLAFVFVSFSSLKAEEGSFKINGYLDTYIATDNDHLTQSEGFSNNRIYAYPDIKKNEFGLNLAQVSLVGTYGIARGNLVLNMGEMAGNSSIFTNSPFIQQANMGFRLCDNFWVDAGYFLSHIGDESFIPGNNWLSSYSLLKLEQPYFQAGVRFGYETEKFKAQLYIVNAAGQFQENNYNKTFGIYIGYNPMENLHVSYANVIGNEAPGTPILARLQMIHNFCGEFEISEEFALKGEIDYKSIENVSGDPNTYFGISLQGHYLFNQNYSATARFAMISTSNPATDPDLAGNCITLGGEYKPTLNTYFRLEGSMLSFGDNFRYFRDADGKPTGSRMELLLNFGIFFN